MKKLQQRSDVDGTVQDLAIRLVDTQTPQNAPVDSNSPMVFARDIFVLLDGPSLLISLFKPPSWLRENEDEDDGTKFLGDPFRGGEKRRGHSTRLPHSSPSHF